MSAAVVQRPQGHYFKVLESQKKRLGDYEQIHFRKSTITTEQRMDIINQGSMVKHVLYEEISLTPRRASRPQLVPFDKNTAATYLRQTETQWLMPNLSRQDAAKLLFNKPTGTFVVRNSQKARYALTLRMPQNDPAVNHFLIQTNQQNFLTIQGSNLPFLSIYDLLAYFCFNQSGGMPCCLKAPVSTIQEDSSDSSDSEIDEPQPYSLPSPLPQSTPPKIPPKGQKIQAERHKKEMVEVFNIVSKQEDCFLRSVSEGAPQLYPSKAAKGESRSTGASPIMKNKVPPPKPPRTGIPFDYVPVEYGEQVELYQSARRVSGLVDMELSRLCIMDRQPPTSSLDASDSDKFLPPVGPIPAPSVVNRQVDSPVALSEVKLRLPAAKSVDSALNTPPVSPKVNSLIQMFESNPPSPSPPCQNSPPMRSKRSPPSPRRISKQSNDAPLLPPRPQPPPIPPKPMFPVEGETPTVPPRTPAPVIPPKPSSSKQMLRLHTHQRSLSDSQTPVNEERRGAEPSRSSTRLEYMENDAKLSSRRSVHVYEPIEFLGAQEKTVSTQSTHERHSKASVSSQEEQLEGTVTSDPKSSRWTALPSWAKKLKLHRKPRKKIRKFITSLASDPSQEFGRKISEFIAEMKANSMEPHQKMLSEIRNFITEMYEYLLTEHKTGLVNCGMESCDNFAHVMETTLQQVILHPLSHYIYLRIEEYYSQNGFLFQVQRSIHQGRLKQPEEMGIRKNLLVPGEKVVAELTEVFSRMMKTPCAISKLEYLLEAVRLTYENVKDAKQPKKSMNDLGADDFLPLFVWVLAQCGFYRAEIEAEYMWGLAHPSLFNGEGGYYLTTLTSAVNVLKELSQGPAQPLNTQQQLPTMNEMQTELKVYCEDEHTGQYSSAFYLPIVPTMTAQEICEEIANRRRIPNPEKYALFKVINGKASRIEDQERPQEVKLQWTLDRNSRESAVAGSAYQPSTRFIAYKLRMPVQ